MNCPQNIDWKAYALKEMDGSARREAVAHLACCEACQEELSGLETTFAALSALHEEEVPRRIAFVSDKVFEPRWWQRFLSPTFASACVLALAIVFHATYVSRGPSEAEVNARINKEVAREVQSRTAWLDTMEEPVMQIVKARMQLVNN